MCEVFSHSNIYNAKIFLLSMNFHIDCSYKQAKKIIKALDFLFKSPITVYMQSLIKNIFCGLMRRLTHF